VSGALSPSQQAELYRVAPHVAQDMIKKDFEIANLCMRTQSAALELEGRKYDYAMQFLNLATDEPTYQSWRAFAATMLNPRTWR